MKITKRQLRRIIKEAQFGRFTGRAAPLDVPMRDSGPVPKDQLRKIADIFINDMGMSPEEVLSKPEFVEQGITDLRQLEEGKTKITKRQLRRIIKEAVEQAIYDQFSEDDVEELSYLLHDKDHTALNNNPAIEKAFRLYGETTTMPLYRGVYKVEAQILQSQNIGDTFQLGRVTSFSENKNIAQGFASQGIMIEVVPGAEGCFNLMAFHVDFLNKIEAESPESFDMIDGDYQREESRREAEWLFPADSTYELLDTPEEGGLTIYKVKKV